MEGMEGMLQNVVELQMKVPVKAKQAVTKGAIEYQNILMKNTPYDSFELLNATELTGFKNGTKGSIERQVGFNKKEGWRAHFPNSGTIYQAGQHFIEKTDSQAKQKVQVIYVTAMKEAGLL